MIFTKKFSVIYLTRWQAYWAEYSSQGELQSQIVANDWDMDSLPAVFTKMAEFGPQNLRLVVGEEFCYVTTLPMSGDDRRLIRDEARGNIPDQLAGNWDFVKEKDQSFPSLVAAIQPQFFQTLNQSLAHSGFQVESIEPQSVALARLTPPKEVSIYIAKDEKILLGAVRDQVVLTTYIVKEEGVINALTKFIAFVSKRYGFLPDKFYVNRNIKAEALEKSFPSVIFEIFDLNPLKGTALKRHLSGNDSKVMNLVGQEE